MHELTRRQVLRTIAALCAGSTAGILRAQAAPPARAATKPRKFFIVLTCTGGASIIDSFLAVRASETPDQLALNTFPDDEVADIEGSPFRAVTLSDATMAAEGFGGSTYAFARDAQLQFARAHHAEMLLAQYDATSVNHPIAQYRALTGAGAWRGRTLQECFALDYGADLPLANVNMGRLGFLEHGLDPTIPRWARREAVPAPLDWCLGLHASRGQPSLPSRELIDLARTVRDRELEVDSRFRAANAGDAALARWHTDKVETARRLEDGDLITKLAIGKDADWLPPSPDRDKVRRAFPRIDDDPLEAQAALTFLLIKHQVAASVTFGPGYEPVVVPGVGLVNAFTAFDLAHGHTRLVQAAMWSRVLDVAGRLITLLREELFDSASGESCWDRTVMYFATEFGRTRSRPVTGDRAVLNFPTGHYSNNAVLLVSPHVRGNTFLGGIDPRTTMLHGFDPTSGAPQNDRVMSEAELFSGILAALDCDTVGSGLPAVTALKRPV